mgnify:CR=1 FL=1
MEKQNVKVSIQKTILNLITAKFPFFTPTKVTNNKTSEGRTITFYVNKSIRPFTDAEEKSLFSLIRENPVLMDEEMECTLLTYSKVKQKFYVFLTERKKISEVKEVKAAAEVKEAPKFNKLVMDDLFKLISQNIKEHFKIKDTTKNVVVDLFIKQGGSVEITITNVVKQHVRISLFDRIRTFLKGTKFRITSCLWIKNEDKTNDYFQIILKSND